MLSAPAIVLIGALAATTAIAPFTCNRLSQALCCQASGIEPGSTLNCTAGGQNWTCTQPAATTNTLAFWCFKVGAGENGQEDCRDIPDDVVHTDGVCVIADVKCGTTYKSCPPEPATATTITCETKQLAGGLCTGPAGPR